MLWDSMLQRILPLNNRELCPYEDVMTFGIWRRFLFLNDSLFFIVKTSDKTAGLIYLVHLCSLLQWIVISSGITSSCSNADA